MEVNKMMAQARCLRLLLPMLSEARRYAAAAKKERADHYSANVPAIREIQSTRARPAVRPKALSLWV